MVALLKWIVITGLFKSELNEVRSLKTPLTKTIKLYPKSLNAGCVTDDQ